MEKKKKEEGRRQGSVGGIKTVSVSLLLKLLQIKTPTENQQRV